MLSKFDVKVPSSDKEERKEKTCVQYRSDEAVFIIEYWIA